jgi:hypothetical protein
VARILGVIDTTRAGKWNGGLGLAPLRFCVNLTRKPLSDIVGELSMHTGRILAFATMMFFASFGASWATLITVHYTGAYTGTWQGNYDPTMPSLGGPTSGQIALTPFDMRIHFSAVGKLLNF